MGQHLSQMPSEGMGKKGYPFFGCLTFQGNPSPPPKKKGRNGRHGAAWLTPFICQEAPGFLALAFLGSRAFWPLTCGQRGREQLQRRLLFAWLSALACQHEIRTRRKRASKGLSDRINFGGDCFQGGRWCMANQGWLPFERSISSKGRFAASKWDVGRERLWASPRNWSRSGTLDTENAHSKPAVGLPQSGELPYHGKGHQESDAMGSAPANDHLNMTAVSLG